MSEPTDTANERPTTLAAMYEAAVRELAELDGYRARLLGRADTLRELCEGGLAQTVVAQPAAGLSEQGHGLGAPE